MEHALPDFIHAFFKREITFDGLNWWIIWDLKHKLALLNIMAHQHRYKVRIIQKIQHASIIVFDHLPANIFRPEMYINKVLKILVANHLYA